MKFTHRRRDIQLRKFIIRNTYWSISFISTISFLFGGGFAYNFFSAKVEINNARILALEKQITEIKNEQKSSFEWIAVTENHFQKILAEAKLANDKKQQENIKQLIEKLERIK